MKKLYFAVPLTFMWITAYTLHGIDIKPEDWYAFPLIVTVVGGFLALFIFAVEKQSN